MFLIDSLLVGGLRFVLEKVTLAVDQVRVEARPQGSEDAHAAATGVARARRTTEVDERVGGDRDA